MGNIAESCLAICNKKDEEDYSPGQYNIMNTNNSDMAYSIIENESKNENNILSTGKYTKIKKLSSNSDVVKDSSNMHYLMKTIPYKKYIKNSHFLKIIENLKSLDHSHILKLYDSFTDDDNIYFIYEYSEENNLLEKIKKGENFDEEKIKIIIKTILTTLQFLEEKKQIVNVGLRLDNIIFNQEKDNDQIFQIKIPVIDCLDENYDTSENSLVYYPPEVIEEIKENNLVKNNFNKDNSEEQIEDANNEWACGIIMYYLIAGEFPFKGKTKKKIFSKIENKDIDFSSPKFFSISEECKELISKLLDKDKSQRIVINAALGHPFITGEKMSSFNFENLEEKEEIDMKSLVNLSSYKAPKSKIHEVINEYIYDNFLAEEEKKKLNDLFIYINKDENENLSEENLRLALIESNYFQEEEIKSILDNFNLNEKKFVPKKEFLCAICEKEFLYDELYIRKLFFEITKDDEEKVINSSNLQKFLSKDEKVKNYVKDELNQPFGMNPEDNMKFEQFNKVVAFNKLYSEIKSKKDEKKPKNTFGNLKMLKDMLKNSIDEEKEKKNES